MATMNISLPDPMKEWVERQTHDGRYANHSDYVRDLIRKDQEKKDKLQSLQAAILDGFNSDDGSELDIEEIKRIARLKIKQQDG
ncbi:MAG: type II toxin-antitoxin system ParD family antitoxin [Proteobacteria bacterium]|nr:type II toxin-antitoxin system ParD family antitoxin [Pseudomonadota bacterium]